MAISISALFAECGNAPWQSKGISVAVTQAFLGQKTAQSHSPMAPGKLTCLRQIFKRELLLFPQILWRFQRRVFCKLHPESTAFRSTVMAHQPFPSKPLHAWKPFQETCLYRDIFFFRNYTCIWRDRGFFPFKSSAVYSQRAVRENAVEIPSIL